MSTFAVSREDLCESLDEAEAAAVRRVERGPLSSVEVRAPDGSVASTVTREGHQVVVSREPRWRHGACPACASPVLRVATATSEGEPFQAHYRCSRRECDFLDGD
jgi:hypothetical protein